MIIKITLDEAKKAIKHYYEKEKNFNIGDVEIEIVNKGIKGIKGIKVKEVSFELDIIEDIQEDISVSDKSKIDKKKGK